mmetsp:Transcript_27435/g.66734  ORF Transcript_27435/g.66734 Transcript_27435/m.66734 type:complete len:348 (-) Transcript_27435:241-1284(-)
MTNDQDHPPHPTPSVQGFEYAPQPHILRALQKDQYYLSALHQRIETLATNIYGRHASRVEDEIRTFAYCAYFSLTTLVGRQTLGEEYCDIVQVDAHRRPPSILRRACLVIIKCLVPYMYRKFAANLRAIDGEEDDDEAVIERRSSLRIFCASILAAVRALHPYMDTIQDLHTALFYFFGRYLEISKTICNVQYLFLQRNRGQVGYQVLGILLGTQLMGSLLILTADRLRAFAASSTSEGTNIEEIGTDLGSTSSLEQNSGEETLDGEKGEDEKNRPTCVFCFDTRRNTTATECGHLFCWDCIVSCCDRRGECPLCRQPIRRQTLVRLEHYRPSVEHEEEDEDDEVIG